MPANSVRHTMQKLRGVYTRQDNLVNQTELSYSVSPTGSLNKSNGLAVKWASMSHVITL